VICLGSGDDNTCELELATVTSPPVFKTSVTSPPVFKTYAKELDGREDRNINNSSNDNYNEREVRPIPAAQLRQAHLQLHPTSASAPCSPRLGLRRPQQQITITSSATLKVTNNNSASGGRSTPRDRSKSPAVNRYYYFFTIAP
jgi:hypothetical protein